MSVCLLEIPYPHTEINNVQLWANDYSCDVFRIDQGEDTIYLDRVDAIRIAEAILNYASGT